MRAAVGRPRRREPSRAPGRRSLRAAAAALLVLGLAGAPTAPLAQVEAARVNGVGIPRARLDRYLELHAGRKGRNMAAIQSPAAHRKLLREALDELIGEELLAQEAARLGLAPAEADVEAALEAERARTPGPAQFEIRLDREGFTAEGFREHLRRRLLLARLLGREAEATAPPGDEAVRAYHEANAERIGRPLAEAREVVRQHLRDRAAQEALLGRIPALRAAAKVELLVPLEPRP